MMSRPLSWLIVLLMLVMGLSPYPVYAHKKHKKKKPTTVTQPVKKPDETSTTNGKAVPPESLSAPSANEQTHLPNQTAPQVTEPEEEAIEELPPLRELLFEHLHNKLVHFPIAFGLAGALFIFLGFKWKAFEASARVMFLLGGIFAIAAYFTGQSQADAFEDSFLHEYVELHEKLGITTGLMLWISFLMSINPKLKRFLWIAAVLLVILISVTGFYGGILAHAG